MVSAQEKLRTALVAVSIKSPAMPVLSNVMAQPHGGAEEIRQKLVQQVTSSVRWEDSMRYLLAQGFNRFIELGPGAALSGFMKRIDKNAQMLNVEDGLSLAKTVEALRGRET